MRATDTENERSLKRFSSRARTSAWGTLIVLAIAAGCSGAPVAASAERPVKTQRTYYAEERLEQIRDELSGAVSRADNYLDENSLTDMWRLVTGQGVPRAYNIHSESTSVRPPSAGSWKLRVDMDGERRVMPSNDFEAFYKSGLNEYGWFDPDLADRSLLVNELYPDKPEDWGVDDGWGWTDPETGRIWVFVGNYNHYQRWYPVFDKVDTFRDAYLYTGDPKYARAGMAILARIADVYPEMDVSAYDRQGGFVVASGSTRQGRILGSIWETNRLRNLAAAYDAFFPLVQEGDDELVAFLQEKTREYRAGDYARTIGGIARHIEDNIVREILPATEAAQIRGNFGQHHSALTMAAVVLDEPGGYTDEVIEFIFRQGGYESSGGRHRVTGGDFLPVLMSRIDRDGVGYESSYNYNRILRSHILRVADIFRYYVGYEGVNLWEHPKVLKVRDSLHRLVMLDRYVPNIGNEGRPGRPQSNVPGGSPVESDLMAGYGLAALRDGERAGDLPDDRRAAWIYFGRNAMRTEDGERLGTWHAHRDTLNLGLYAFGLDLAPDLGYPDIARPHPKYGNWLRNTLSHNTVVVDASTQRPQWASIPRHFDDSRLVKLADIEAPLVYPQTELYRRTTAMVRIDSANSYVVDFFRVKGGEDHLFSFHAAGREVSAEGLQRVEQEGGTYAGENVPFPEDYTQDTEYNREYGTGFNYLFNVERDREPPENFAVEWKIEDFWNVLSGDEADSIRLRLSMLGQADEVALADGEPPQRAGTPDRLRYMLARRQGPDLETVFTSVLEPYQGQRLLTEIEALPVRTADGEPVPETEVRALRVTLADGRRDYIVSSLDPDGQYMVNGELAVEGAFAHLRVDASGRPVDGYLKSGRVLALNDRSLIRESRGRLEGRLLDFTREVSAENFIEIELSDAAGHLDELPGRWVYVETDNWRNGAYEIQDVEVLGDDRFRLHLGNVTLIRGVLDEPSPGNYEFEYNLEEGAALSLPLSRTWSGE